MGFPMQWIEESNRIFLLDDRKQTAAEITFPTGDGADVVIDHTYVDPALRGQGIAGSLMERTVALLRRTGRKARPVCPYAVTWFEKHPDCANVLVGGNGPEDATGVNE